MEKHYVNIDWDFDPLVDMDLTRFKKRLSVILVEEINSEFLDKLRDSGLVLLSAEIFHSWPGFTNSSHIDGPATDPSLPWPSRCKINWVNNSSTLTEWYSVASENRLPLTKSVTMIGSNYVNYDNVPKRVSESAYLQGWHLFEAGMPHKVFNRSTQHRWCIAFVVCVKDVPGVIPSVLAVQERLQNL